MTSRPSQPLTRPAALADPPAPKADSAGRPRRGGSREPFFDNAKLLAIVLVVAGHAWEPLRDSRTIWAAYLLVFMFHMPVFIVISGYFSRSFSYRPRQIERLLSGVVVPYVVFETAYTIYGNTVEGKHMHLSLTAPWYLTWFLIALLLWRLTAPIWNTVRWPFTTAVVISVLAASTHLGADFSLDRVFQMLPFFVLGLVMRPEHWQRLRARWIRIASVPVFAAAAVAAYWAKPRMTAEWAYHRSDWGELDASSTFGLEMSLGLLAVSLILTAAFLSWVPWRHTWFTHLGEGTLYAYLLHGFVIRAARWEGWYDGPFWHTASGEAVITLIAVAFALVLTTPLVRHLFRFALEPNLNWLIRGIPRQPPVSPRPRETPEEAAPTTPPAP